MHHKPLTMHELNSCRGRRVACAFLFFRERFPATYDLRQAAQRTVYCFSIRKNFATSVPNTPTLLPRAYRCACFPRTPFENSYSRSISLFFSGAFFMIPSFSSARDSRADNVNIYRLVQCGRHSAIQIVRADVYCYNCIPLNVEHDSEIRLDFGGVNDATIASRKLLDFVGAHAGIKWVLFEDKKRLACATLLLARAAFRNFSRTRESRNRYFIYHPDTAHSARYPGLQIGQLLHRPSLA